VTYLSDSLIGKVAKYFNDIRVWFQLYKGRDVQPLLELSCVLVYSQCKKESVMIHKRNKIVYTRVGYM